MCLMWWGVGVWLYWGHPPRYDEFYYTFWARYWLDFDLDYLARNWPGTMIRPYLYQLFLAVIGAPFPFVLEKTEGRLYIASVQILLYVISVLRLAQHVQSVHGRKISVALLFGLLAMPFPVFTQVEVLSEGLGLSMFCWFVITATQVVGSVRGARVLAKFACVAFLAAGMVLIRSAFVPAVLVAVTLTALGVARIAVGRPVGAVLRLAGYLIMLVVPVVMLIFPQAYLMTEHIKYFGYDSSLWGVGSAQITWSMVMAKYSTSFVFCENGPVGFEYPMPLLSETERVSILAQSEISVWSVVGWYFLHPHAGLLHLFAALSHDFPTTYVTTFNPVVSIGFNALGMLVVSAGMVTLVGRTRDVRGGLTRASWERASRSGTDVVVLVVATLWGMTWFTAVETRFGIIPWCGLAVGASYGVSSWVDDFMLGRRRWGEVGVTVLLASSGLLLSRWLLSTVESVTRAIAAGC